MRHNIERLGSISPGQSMPFKINIQSYIVSCCPLACELHRIRRRRQHARLHLSLISFTMDGLDLIQHTFQLNFILCVKTYRVVFLNKKKKTVSSKSELLFQEILLLRKVVIGCLAVFFLVLKLGGYQ